MKFANTYSNLGDAFYHRILPTPVSKPELLLWNTALAGQLNLPKSLMEDSLLQAQYFSGNKLPEGADSMALAYSGHQFGHLNPQLGDGRAHLLGEVFDRDHHRVDIQLKGSGPTPFSRQGDGRCALGPAIREYIMSEAMYHLRVPTSRCLAVVTTGEEVYRERVSPGAVVTRVADSHIRVGTFQYFAIRNDLESLQALLEYSIKRHYPEVDAAIDELEGDKPSDDKPCDDKASDNSTSHANSRLRDLSLGFIETVMGRQVTLIVEWMRVGFIHGVMNTDNTAISGETIDFGPCAMMGVYKPDTVYSSIDKQGRYAFANQPRIALWNITRMAECLIPFIDVDEKKAVALLESLLTPFLEQFEKARYKMMANKLGLDDIEIEGRGFINDLLQTMEDGELDYTQTFTQLTQSLGSEEGKKNLAVKLGGWYDSWKQRLVDSGKSIEHAKALMEKNNPIVIPRNHHVEAVLADCENTGSTQAVENFLKVLRSPYRELPTTKNYQDSPEDGDELYQTFCGT